MEGFLSFCSLLSCLGGILLVTPTQVVLAILLAHDYEYLPIADELRQSTAASCTWAAVFYLISAVVCIVLLRRLRQRPSADARHIPEIFSESDRAELAAVAK
jgi:hypothetical protein